jgi:hypothetical protein
MKLVYFLLFSLFALQGCAIQGTQKFTPTGIKLSNSVGLGTEAFIDEEESYGPASITYNQNNYYNSVPKTVINYDHYCPDIVLEPVGWY